MSTMSWWPTLHSEHMATACSNLTSLFLQATGMMLSRACFWTTSQGSSTPCLPGRAHESNTHQCPSAASSCQVSLAVRPCLLDRACQYLRASASKNPAAACCITVAAKASPPKSSRTLQAAWLCSGHPDRPGCSCTACCRQRAHSWQQGAAGQPAQACSRSRSGSCHACPPPQACP